MLAHDFVEPPAPTESALKMVSKGNAVIWIGCLFRTHRIVRRRAFRIDNAVDVFVAFDLVRLFRQTVNRDIKEVSGGHYDDAQLFVS